MKHFKTAIIFIALISIISCRKSTTPNAGDNKTEKIVLAYVTSWSDVMPDPAYLTHINYAFGHVNDSFDGIRIDNEQRLKNLVQLKEKSPSLKILLSIGGWGSGRFSEMAANEDTRKRFARDCKRVVDEYGLDGIDIDWEYPTSHEAGISSSPDDTENFTLLMKDIRKEIGKSKLLTLASVASAEYIDFPAISPYIDFVNIMSYDMGNPPYHHSGLYRSEHTNWLSVDEAVTAHVNAGIPIERLVMGIPFYGRGIEETGGYTNFNRIPQLTQYEKKWDDISQAPFLADSLGNHILGYDDTLSIGIKTRYILDKGMLGAMYWEYAGDDADGTLRKIIYNRLHEQ